MTAIYNSLRFIFPQIERLHFSDQDHPDRSLRERKRKLRWWIDCDGSFPIRR